MQVLPRLYLMITAGACYIRTGQASVKDVLSDMAEMAKGVQQPMRGLFLRNYLSHITRDKLPGSGPAYQGSGGRCGQRFVWSVRSSAPCPAPDLLVYPLVCSVNDSVDFVLENFCESNRLWVRMHQQSGTKDKKRREKERKGELSYAQARASSRC
jgi:vacuolar protein sorting-associated protein 35